MPIQYVLSYPLKIIYEGMLSNELAYSAAFEYTLKQYPAGGVGLLLIAHIPSNNVQVEA